MVFGETISELVSKAAARGGLSLSEWEAVSIIGRGADIKGAPWTLAAKVDGKWRMYNELNDLYTQRVRGRVKFVEIPREQLKEYEVSVWVEGTLFRGGAYNVCHNIIAPDENVAREIAYGMTRKEIEEARDDDSWEIITPETIVEEVS
jgi:hypothetical protein